MECEKCGELEYCSWTCQVDDAKRNGATVIAPNGLPIRCIKANGTLLEDPHADHPDYKFPVTARYVGEITEAHREDYRNLADRDATSEAEVRDMFTETHARIYTDGWIAITLYECCYAVFTLHAGDMVWGSLWKPREYQLDEESLAKIEKLNADNDAKRQLEN